MHLRIALVALCLPAILATTNTCAQIPTQCLEIESILVDACIDLAACPGASEGQNEMVRFRTGPLPIALDEIAAEWPNNSWNGLVQNVATSDLTTALNATIQGCGWLLEPPAGIIPPGSQVLMVTSTIMCVAANSFANLSDTLFIVFQAPGNTSGHFANHNNGGTVSPVPVGATSLRMLVLSYLPSSCSDTVYYDRSLLTNTLGSYGGGAALNDGATAQFSWPGPAVVSYVNYGCQAPFEPLLVEVTDAVGSICNGSGNVLLTGSITGAYETVLWQGGTGSFSDPTSLTTAYIAGAGDTGPVVVQLCAIGSCGAPVCIDFTLPGGSAPFVSISVNGPITLCPGESVTLTASGADTYLWSTQESSASITVSTPGTYSVVGTNACGNGSAQQMVTAATGPTVVITPNGPTSLCPGDAITLTASGADSYLWNTQEPTPSITVTQAGTYSVTGTNSCGTGGAQIIITEGSDPEVGITASGPLRLCPGQSLTLSASGAVSYVWNTQATSTSITVTQPGVYSVTGTNACGTGTASVGVIGVVLDAAFSTDVTTGVSPLTVTFTETSPAPGISTTWQFGDNSNGVGQTIAHTYTQPGTYTVIMTITDQGCTDTATGQIIVISNATGPSSVTVPNVFTPNGDGVNDQLRMDATGLNSVTLRIFNRYGQQVALLERAQQSWDARTFAGEIASEGTYFYILNAEGIDGKEFEESGHITLLR
ncbi:MAG: gliding motility-associated C-terminal domain-containing protein [Flavobacteriales bacterium]|nr:gliding motility-associated C-terminal domain-containing protein [Flavobacteriales bacterium]